MNLGATTAVKLPVKRKWCVSTDLKFKNQQPGSRKKVDVHVSYQYSHGVDQQTKQVELGTENRGMVQRAFGGANSEENSEKVVGTWQQQEEWTANSQRYTTAVNI